MEGTAGLSQQSGAGVKGIYLGLDPDANGSRVAFGNGKFIDS